MNKRFTKSDYFTAGLKMAAGTPTEIGEKLERQMVQMKENADKWRKENAMRDVLVQFNYPPKVALIAAISDAVKHKYVVTNEAGLELIKAMWPWGGNDEPTVNMVRVILEHEDGPTNISLPTSR